VCTARGVESRENRRAMATFETGLDVLVPCIQPGSEYFASISNQLLNGDGFVVLKAVLTEDECQMELDRMWSFVTKVMPFSS